MNRSLNLHDVIELRLRESGATFPAIVARVTNAGRAKVCWERRDGALRGQLTQASLLDLSRFEVLGPASDADTKHLRRIFA